MDDLACSELISDGSKIPLDDPTPWYAQTQGGGIAQDDGEYQEFPFDDQTYEVGLALGIEHPYNMADVERVTAMAQ